MSDAEVHLPTFRTHLARLVTAWNEQHRAGDESAFGGADALAILHGKPDPERPYTKTSAMMVSDCRVPFYAFEISADTCVALALRI